MVRHTLEILQQILQDFLSVSAQFGTLCIERLSHRSHHIEASLLISYANHVIVFYMMETP